MRFSSLSRSSVLISSFTFLLAAGLLIFSNPHSRAVRRGYRTAGRDSDRSFRSYGSGC